MIIQQIIAIQSIKSFEECINNKDASSENNEMIIVNDVSTIGDDFHLVQQVFTLDISKSNFKLDVGKVKLDRLNTLIAAKNYKLNIDEITEETFPNLSFLNLSSNTIAQIRPDIFQYIRHLVELDLSFNCLETINFKFLFENSNAEIASIYLQGNFLISLGSQPLIEDVLYLNSFDLSFNRLEEFQFINIHVHHLQLSHNMIKKIGISVDHHYKTDMKFNVDASANQIEKFESNIFYKHIDLSSNQITSLRNLSYAGAEYLNLTNNKIASVRDQDFEVYNGFDKITTPQGFKKFRDCKALDISSNQLTYINYKTIPQILPNLEKLVLLQNQFPLDFMKQLISYSKSDECKIEMIVEENLESKSRVLLWIISVGLSVIASITVMIFLFKKKKINYSKYFIIFKDNEILTDEYR